MATELDRKLVDHTKTTPFLLKSCIQSGGFHPETVFDEGRLPTLDKHAVHVWNDSTLHDTVHSLHAQAPSPSLPAGAFRSPGTKYSFRVIFFDRGVVTSRDLGHVYRRDLNDIAALHPSTVGQTPTPPAEPTELPADDTMDADDDAPRRDRVDPDVNDSNANNPSARRSKQTIKTLAEHHVQVGDWLSVSIALPASAKPAIGPAGLAIRGAEREGEEAGGGHWRGGGGGGGGGRPAGLVRGGGHLAASQDRETASGPGAGHDRPPPRDFSPPRRRDSAPEDRRGRGAGYGRRSSPDMTRGGTSYRPNPRPNRSRERRSRSPVGWRRNGRYERDEDGITWHSGKSASGQEKRVAKATRLG
ncbi:hypothetical protein FS749_004055 [Ceratobasidium sp. UAMH 11750]|nr:hypothetical protein FS749_004055 [Ceratobasidium sp. UAMH 11750]